jgi:rhamnosyltransferase
LHTIEKHSNNKFKVVAIVVTFNPDLTLLEKCLASVSEQVDKIIIVDNASKNVENVTALCEKFRCDFLENRFNAGVPYALKRGVEHSLHYSPEWILFLDQDSIVFDGAIAKAMQLYHTLPNHLRAQIGIIALGQRESQSPCTMREVVYHTFSGTLIKTELAREIPFRVNFFLDQADFDLYARVREQGYKTELIDCKLMQHRIGTPIFIPFVAKTKILLVKILEKIGIRRIGHIMIANDISKVISYESPSRYYYIVRNSLILLMEKRKDVITFITDILWAGLAIICVDRFDKFLKAFILGLSHGITKRQGYLNKTI